MWSAIPERRDAVIAKKKKKPGSARPLWRSIRPVTSYL